MALTVDEFFSPANRKSPTLRRLSPSTIRELELIAAGGVDLSDEDDELTLERIGDDRP